MGKTVLDFYRSFDFEKVITNPPRPIQEFLDGEIEFITQQISKGADILEVGCGYGRLLNVLSAAAHTTVGVDFSEPLLERARKLLNNRPNVELLLGDAQNIELPSASFDYVLCLDASFGNMPGIEVKVLKEMARLAKSGGQVIVSVFSEAAKDAQLENYRRVGLTDLTDDGTAVRSAEGFYSRRFTKEQLQTLFADAGLDVAITSICPINYVAISTKS